MPLFPLEHMAMRNGTAVLMVLAALCFAFESCERIEDHLVAEVGDTRITVREYDRMADKLLDGPYREAGQIDLAAKERLLDTIISKEVLLIEGLARGLDSAPDIVRELDRLERRLTIRMLYDRDAVGEIDLAEEEVELYFYEGKFDEEICTSHILCASEEEACQVLEELRNGASFEKLAVERSLHGASARRGGDMGFLAKGILLPELQEQILSLQIGQLYPRPVKSTYGFHVFKTTDRRIVDFESRKSYIEEMLRRQKRAERIAEYVAVLKERYNMTYNAEASKWLVPEAASTGDPETRLITWNGGGLTAAEYRGALKEAGDEGSVPPDTAAVRAFAENLAVERIFSSEARRKGYDRDEGIRSQIRGRRDELIADKLYRLEATDRVSVSEEDLRTFYEAHPEEYRARPVVWLQEIMVEAEEEADRLLARIAGGADMGDLAGQYSIRGETRERGGKMRLMQRENPRLGRLAEMAFEADPDTLYGPISVPGGFSVFKVLRRGQTRPKSFEEVRKSIERTLRINAQNEAMDRFLEALKSKYRSRIKIHRDALELTLRGRDREIGR